MYAMKKNKFVYGKFLFINTSSERKEKKKTYFGAIIIYVDSDNRYTSQIVRVRTMNLSTNVERQSCVKR